MKFLIPIMIISSFMLVVIYYLSDSYGIQETGIPNSIYNQTVSLSLVALDPLGFVIPNSNKFSIGDQISVDVEVTSRTGTSVPVSLYIYKETDENNRNIVSNDTKLVTVEPFIPFYLQQPYYQAKSNDTTEPDFYYGRNNFYLNGISDQGSYIIKASIPGTNNYAKVTAIFQSKSLSFFYNEILTFQNFKLLAAFLSLMGMISYLIVQVKRWTREEPLDKRSQQMNELIGFILMTIMVYSIVSYLSAVDTPIGANTSFGIVSRSDLSSESLASGRVSPELLKNIKKEWVLNLGGTAQSICIETKSGNLTSGEKINEKDTGNPCSFAYQTLNPSLTTRYEPHVIFNGGVQIPLYVPILGFIGAYLRYVYNITVKTIKIQKGKEKETIFDSLKDFLHEFLVIILSPIAALALWLFFRQASIVSDLTLALSSITIGLGLEPFIKRLERWLPEQLEGDKPEGDKPEGDKPEGDKPEGDKPEGDKPEGDKPEGDKPEG